MFTTDVSLTKGLGPAKAASPLLSYVLPPLHFLNQAS